MADAKSFKDLKLIYNKGITEEGRDARRPDDAKDVIPITHAPNTVNQKDYAMPLSQIGVSTVGTCATEADEQIKEVSVISGSFPFNTEKADEAIGREILVKFTNRNTADSPKIQIGNMEAMPIVCIGGTSIVGEGCWEAGAAMKFTFDGESWLMHSNVAQKTVDYTILSDGTTVYTKPQVEDVFVKKSEKGAVNGVAVLDSNGRILVDELPTQALVYLGQWDASKGTYPKNGTTIGDFYIVSVEGTVSSVKFYAGDWIIWNGSVWNRSANTNAVSSVAGKTGAVTLSSSDVGLGNVANTGDSATPVSGGTTKFTTGGAYTELNKKVDKVTGKGLSTNDYTTAEKEKLASIAAGASTGTVTSVAVKMNGTTKGTVTKSGTIDLGTVLTAHQSLDGYIKESAKSIGQSGYLKLTNNLIIQWGQATANNISNEKWTHTFNIEFPTMCTFIDYIAIDNGRTDDWYIHSVISITKSTAYLQDKNIAFNNSHTYLWFAIGY